MDNNDDLKRYINDTDDETVLERHADITDEASLGASGSITGGVIGAEAAGGLVSPMGGAVVGQMAATDIVRNEADAGGTRSPDSEGDDDSFAGEGSTEPPPDAHERQVIAAEIEERDRLR